MGGGGKVNYYATGFTVFCEGCTGKFSVPKEAIKTQGNIIWHVVDKNDLHTSSAKCQAIVDAPAPKNVQELPSPD